MAIHRSAGFPGSPFVVCCVERARRLRDAAAAPRRASPRLAAPSHRLPRLSRPQGAAGLLPPKTSAMVLDSLLGGYEDSDEDRGREPCPACGSSPAAHLSRERERERERERDGFTSYAPVRTPPRRGGGGGACPCPCEVRLGCSTRRRARLKTRSESPLRQAARRDARVSVAVRRSVVARAWDLGRVGTRAAALPGHVRGCARISA